ncbi:hypothetical protein KC354_g10083 [Hortaea werneckii]|nr:hypothetical protein KC354_g10083 [Hortaea werneckii]
MSDQRPWSNDEKNELLAEIIKTASPHPSVLSNVVASLNIQPRWDDTPLPRGRSLNQCRFVFEEMRRTQGTHSIVSGHLGPQTPLSAPPPGLKRPFQLEAPYPAGREIRPKPFPPPGAPAQPSVSEPPVKRKRGRPTKAQAQAKAEAEAHARGSSVVAGPAPAVQQQQPQVSPQPGATPAPVEAVPSRVEEQPPQPRATLPPTTRMPISAVLTPTAPKTASNSSSSSGKRRRGRSTRSEPEGLGIGGAGPLHEYESPYGRAEMPEDSPARTAVMRHREEQEPIAFQPLQHHHQQPPDYTAPPAPSPGPEMR